MKILRIVFLIIVTFVLSSGCSSSKTEAGFGSKSSEDYSRPDKTLETFFRAGSSGKIDIVARCFLDWDRVIARSTGYKKFVGHIRAETQNMNYTLFKVGRKDNHLELGIEITSEKPYFRRRDFYYFDYYEGKWLIVTSGWMKGLGCG